MLEGQVNLLAVPLGRRRSSRLSAPPSGTDSRKSSGGLAEAVSLRRQRLPIMREDKSASDSSDDDGEPSVSRARVSQRVTPDDSPSSGRARVTHRFSGRSALQNAGVTKKPPLLPPSSTRGDGATLRASPDSSRERCVPRRERRSVDDMLGSAVPSRPSRDAALLGGVSLQRSQSDTSALASFSASDEFALAPLAPIKLDALPFARSGVSDVTSALCL